MNLLALHTTPVDPAAARACTCLRAECGAAESGPGIPPSGCGAHGAITVRHHRAVDCPALPADADLSALWLIVSTWAGLGPRVERVLPYTRAALAELRAAGALWDLATGESPAAAVQQWQDQRAEAAEQHAAELSEERRRTWLREMSLLALRNSGRRSARRSLARDL